MQFNVASNISAFTKAMDAFGKNQLPFAYAKAINDTAKDVRGQIIEKTWPNDITQRNKNFMRGMAKLAALKMPLNLDAWDGYPAARERLYQDLVAHANNPVSLAGDTHNAWAFDLQTEDGVAVGVEIGTPGISSPGLETYMPIPPADAKQGLLDASPELVYADTSQRGWALMTVRPDSVRTRWRYVSTILSREYSVSESEELVAPAGKRRFDKG